MDLRRWSVLAAGLVAGSGLLGLPWAGPARAAGGGEADTGTVQLVTEQILVLGTIVGAIAALPALIEFLVERRKRRERLDLSLDDEPVSGLDVRFAGQDELLADIADLVDRVRHPEAYRALTLGNEILILGRPLSGKKTLARRIAQLGGIDRIITVYNPRNTDALARAKGLLRSGGSEKVMLLLPNIDEVFDADDEEVEAELDALIETTAARPSVLVVGTASRFEPDGPLDNLFGMKVVLPGTPPFAVRPREIDAALARVLDGVARFYLQRALASGGVLEGQSLDQAVELLLRDAGSPAEIEDIVEAARTAATYRRKTGQARELSITPELLRGAIRRVMARAPAPA